MIFLNLKTKINSLIFYNIKVSSLRPTCIYRIYDLKKYSSKSSISPDNATIIEQIYNSWLKNPSSVHPSWNRYFQEESGGDPATARKQFQLPIGEVRQLPPPPPPPQPPQKELPTIEDYLNVQAVIRSYQIRGHFVADLDPLGIKDVKPIKNFGITRYANELVTKKYFKFNEKHFDQEFQLPKSTFIGGNRNTLKLREIITLLENIYCNKIGIEYMHIPNVQQIEWIQSKFEMPGVMNFTNDQKILIFQRLTRATGFEAFLQKKFPSEKRFGLEGCEMLIPALKQIIDVSTLFGAKSIIMGIAHRGRLNTLANVCRKPLNSILSQFAGLEPSDAGSGDVKYHLGMYIERLNRVTNKNIRLAIVANPSHLESVNPVVQGKTRAEQFYCGDTEGKHVMSILVHGDASNCGQGIVYETMHLSDLPDYTTHGTIHIVINNQIGFTTDPRFSRSSPYCTDVSKVVNAPIFHVNADDPEAVIHCCNVAAEWRAIFHKDVVIDLVCYRRNGHNELDDPMLTQPLMYQRISKLKNCLDQYVEKLVKEGVITKENVHAYWMEYNKICEDAFALSKTETTMKFKDWLDSPWSGFFEGRDMTVVQPTGIKEETLQHIGKVFSSPPPNAQEFVLHKGIERIFAARKQMVNNRVADWAFGEAFAIGSLLKEGHHVRLSGEDVERGTFAHRHHVLHHQTTDKTTYRQLCNLYPDQAKYCVHNSSLSENAVLGFEIGYSLANPNSLNIWEGQFGDFANNAQCMIDQFISCGQQKWVRQSGLVLLLPHGMEGMGPEHSSCRLERFLQLSDDDADEIPKFGKNFALTQLKDLNWIIANCSTPANLFHILRRQLALPFRKPLIIATPKSLLRLPECRSSFDEMLEGTEFRRIIPENNETIFKQPENVKKLIFCTGKVYYELVKARSERNKGTVNDVAITRIEQICPFPYDLIDAELKRYSKAHIIWAQEEHKNQGCWPYVQPRLGNLTCTAGRCIHYHGRAPAAAPATGSKHQYLKELEEFLCGLFGQKLKKESIPKFEIKNINKIKK